jgi:hypothetical protein
MKKLDFVCILKVTEDFGSVPHPDPHPDPDSEPYQNATDPEHY